MEITAQEITTNHYYRDSFIIVATLFYWSEIRPGFWVLPWIKTWAGYLIWKKSLKTLQTNIEPPEEIQVSTQSCVRVILRKGYPASHYVSDLKLSVNQEDRHFIKDYIVSFVVLILSVADIFVVQITSDSPSSIQRGTLDQIMKFTVFSKCKFTSKSIYFTDFDFWIFEFLMLFYFLVIWNKYRTLLITVLSIRSDKLSCLNIRVIIIIITIIISVSN